MKLAVIELPEEKHHNALLQVQLRLQDLATSLGIKLPQDYPSAPTLRKDLETLRNYGILDRRMYRWGYYLGTGAMSQAELKVAVNALASQAQYQGDAQLRRIYETLSKRLRGLDMEMKGEFFYPTRQHLNRAIVYTDPEEMAARGENRDEFRRSRRATARTARKARFSNSEGAFLSTNDSFYSRGRTPPS